jgi:hypothetical protein
MGYLPNRKSKFKIIKLYIIKLLPWYENNVYWANRIERGDIRSCNVETSIQEPLVSEMKTLDVTSVPF